MAWRIPSALSFVPRLYRPDFALVVAGLCVIVCGCDRQLPGAPTDIKLLAISGYVYEEATAASGEPTLADVLITVDEADGSSSTTVSDSRGFYTVPVRAGAISITASKIGFVTGASSFDLSRSTVLNFTLTHN
jgi:Carboxypeptidase regulatory-like domain